MTPQRFAILIGVLLLLQVPCTLDARTVAAPDDHGGIAADTSVTALEPASWRRQRLAVHDGHRSGRGGPAAPHAARSVERARTSASREDPPILDPRLPGVDGNVLDIERSGNTLYIAGSFRRVGEVSGGLVLLDGTTGEVLKPFPKVAGSVHAIIPDGTGGWYIGGNFTGVASVPRAALAQIRADGSVTDWNPGVTGSPGYIDPPRVTALAVCQGRVFVGGGFSEVGGVACENLCAVDGQSGEVLDWNLSTTPEGWVYTLAANDSTVFVGGWFFDVGGQTRNCLAAIDAAAGTVNAWTADANASVHALRIRGDTLIVGGEFGWIAGHDRMYLATLGITTGQVFPFDARLGGVYQDYTPLPGVEALELVGDTLYVGGSFSTVAGLARPSLMSCDLASGDARGWEPPPLGPQYIGWPAPLCTELLVRGDKVYAGGYFNDIGGVSRHHLAALDRRTGVLLDWNPNPDYVVDALVSRGDDVLAGGEFNLVGEWRHRAGLAAIDLAIGELKPWNPNPDGHVCTALAVKDGNVFVSGDFTTIGGDPQPRSRLAALDTLNGEVTAWDPGADGVASVFLLSGDTLFAGGEFSQVGGLPRNCLAALSSTTGSLFAWDPGPNLPVRALALRSDTLFIGGLFGRVASQTRRGIAAVDAGTGVLLPWTADMDSGYVEALLLRGNTLYVGGAFGRLGGRPRSSLGALDAATGLATDWNPGLTEWGVIAPRVRALALVDTDLYVGGTFASVAGEPRICLAAVDTSSGRVTPWDPGLDGYTWTLEADGNTLFVGGGFNRAGGYPAEGLAAFTFEPALPPHPPMTRLAIHAITPNPATTSASIRFALPSPSRVSLEVFDVHGRRVVSLLRDEVRAAGLHDVPLATGDLRGGIYFCRLGAGGAFATRRFVVLR